MADSTDNLIPMSEGVKILYKGVVDNIIFLKRQQWIITNYSLVIYAVVITLNKAPSISAVEKTLLTIVAGIACAYAVACMIHTQLSLTKLRGTQNHVWNTYFDEKEREIYKFWRNAPGFFYTPLFICGLMFANILAMSATIYLIWRIPGAV